MTRMEVAWEGTAPTERGFYWLNEGPKHGTRLVFVGQRPGHAYLCIEDEPNAWTSKRNFRAVDKMPHAKWSGPFMLPVPNYCKCVDCGGTEPGHSSDCTYMKELHG